jgi:hypothetical protein
VIGLVFVSCDSCEVRKAEYKFEYPDATFDICGSCLPIFGYERQMIKLGVGSVVKVSSST